MFNAIFRENKLQKAIDSLLDEMETVNGDSPEYARMTEQLTKLYEAQKSTRTPRLSPDAAFAVIGNLAGILTIVHYEQLGIVTSKALSFVIKPKH